jgi:TolA-binding protein
MNEPLDTWVRGVTAEARGESLDDEQRIAMSEFERDHPEVSLERPLWEAFGDLGSGEGRGEAELENLELAARVLARAQMQESAGAEEGELHGEHRASGGAEGSEHREPRRSGRVTGIAALASVAAAAAILLLGPWELGDMLFGSTATRGVNEDPLTAMPRVDSDHEFRGEGELRQGPPTERRPRGIGSEAEAVGATEGMGDAEETGAEQVEDEVQEEAEQEAEEQAEVPAAPRSSARGKSPREARAVPGDPGELGNPGDVGERLADAQRLLTTSDRRGAMRAYQSLISEYPGAPEAHAARVTLGRLLLADGRARKALVQFDRYLLAGGSLAEEARHGRVRAHARLGDEAAELDAIDSFLEAHPESVHARALSMRAGELR